MYGSMCLLGSDEKEDLHYGGFLANQENIVVVAIKFHLGAHGFLGHSGHYGKAINTVTRDQYMHVESVATHVKKNWGLSFQKLSWTVNQWEPLWSMLISHI